MLSIDELKNKKIEMNFNTSDFGKLLAKGIDYQSHESNICNKWIRHKAKFDILSMKEQVTNDEIDKSIQENIYFVTCQFNPKSIPAKFNSFQQAALADAIASFYNSMCEDFIDYAFGGNSKYLPLLISYFDAEDSRHSKYAGDVQIPHYHGFFLLHPKTRLAFESWLDANGHYKEGDGKPKVLPRGHYPLETITFSKFDPARGALEDAISYVTKYARNDRYVKGEGDFFELSTVCPQVPTRMYPFYKYSNIIEATKLASFGKNDN